MQQKLESFFQKDLTDKLKTIFPGCEIYKLDSKYTQGIPDWIILYGPQWATFETKRTEHAPHQPNQDYYVLKMNNMSFSRFVYPQNEKQFLNELFEFFEGGNKDALESAQRL